ncbi:MAG TPA: hypothetical protein VGT03_02770 [Candidatus Acidoferrales bacterium]|nr:hypothetical protein [Candidatus Acidoferrales bacterium]
MTSIQEIIDATNSLTSVASILNNAAAMARYPDVVGALKTQLNSGLDGLKEVQDEQAKLRTAHLRYLDLEEDKRSLRKRTETVACLLARKVMQEDEKLMRADLEDAGIVLPLRGKERPLTWRLVAEVVRQFPKIQIVELVKTLNDLGWPISRQSVESAITTHSSRFRITHSGREKYVSLK